MKIRMTSKGSNGEQFTSVFKPFEVKIEDGMTTVYLTKEYAVALRNDIKLKQAGGTLHTRQRKHEEL